jgi:hypothetical protein
VRREERKAMNLLEFNFGTYGVNKSGFDFTVSIFGTQKASGSLPRVPGVCETQGTDLISGRVRMKVFGDDVTWRNSNDVSVTSLE